MFYLISSFVGAIIGYITNYIAIKMLFRPYKAKKLGSITIIPQGVIPKEKANLANLNPDAYVLFSKNGFSSELKALKGDEVQLFSVKNLQNLIKREAK